MQITRNTLHNNWLPIPTHQSGNQDQQNYPRHPHALHAFRLHRCFLTLQIILFSILHLDTLLDFSRNLFCVALWTAVVVFVRAVAV